MKRQDVCLLRILAATAALSVTLGSTLVFAQAPGAAAPVVVHEWGTFTSLQDESGKAIGGINTDDEPVPQFVHRVSVSLISQTGAPSLNSKGPPSCHPDVTLRLETPVLYFHPSGSQPEVHAVSVSARFRGGWLTEFYPNADVQAPGVLNHGSEFGPLRSDTIGTLAWNGLHIGGAAAGPETTDHVWTSPRAVNAATVRTSSGEAEKFLFYRGVGHINAPITIARDGQTLQLVLRSHLPSGMRGGQDPLQVKSLWLVDIASNGRVAYRSLPAVTLNGTDKELARTSAQFTPTEYSDTNRERLSASLHHALMEEGLFADEAQALLDTWQVSYFKSTGLRVFFMVPRAWTEFYLPLTVSVPADITRVMVGRVELVTPAQRQILRQIAQLPFLTPSGAGRPDGYAKYLTLGRFRNALLLNEAKNRPTAKLRGFINVFGLGGYTPTSATAANAQ